MRHDWVGKEIHWELCKNFKFDHMNKWYMHNLESALENKTHKIPWNLVMQMDHLIPASHINSQQKKRTCRIEDLVVPAIHRVILKGSEERDKYLDLTRELKKTMEHESDGDTICNWSTRYSHQKMYRDWMTSK